MIKHITKTIHRLEDSLLIALVLAIIVTGLAQIILRNINVQGLTWIDPAMRVSVLWLAMFGALRASREQKHIVIDLLSHYSPPTLRRVTYFIVSIATAVICFIAAYYCTLFVYDEKLNGDTVFLDIPVWICQAIIPFTLALIGLRSLIFSLQPPELTRDNP